MLIRNAEALETLEKVDMLVVDKTGTLTEGKPQSGDGRAAPGVDEGEVLALAASLERASEHPLARGHRAGAEARGVDCRRMEHVPIASPARASPGAWAAAQVAVGNADAAGDAAAWIRCAGGTGGELPAAQGETVMFVAVDGRAAGLLGRRGPRQSIDACEAIRARCTTRACAWSW